MSDEEIPENKLQEYIAIVDKLREHNKLVGINIELVRRMGKVLDYCRPHIEQMWAAKVAGILMDCDFKDAAQKLEEI